MPSHTIPPSSFLARAAALIMAILLTGCGQDGGPSEGNQGQATDPFDDSRLHEVSITMDPADWESILATPQDETYRRARLTWNDYVIGDVGVRAGGESSRFAGNQKMTLRVRFNAFDEALRFGGRKSLTLTGMYDDPSLMRERLGYLVYRAALPTPRSAHSRVTVNGEYRGLYGVEERWDIPAVEERFTAPVGPHYRIRKIGSDYDPYAFLGPEIGNYVPLPWEPKSDHLMAEHAVIGSKLALIDEMEPATLGSAIDIDSFMAYMAAAAIMTNTGYLAGDAVEDHFMYYDPGIDRFHVLPWDPDQSFGRDANDFDRSLFHNFELSVITRIIRDDPTFRSRYKEEVAILMAALPPEALAAEMDAIYEQIQAAAYEDPNKIYPNETFDYNRDYMKTYVIDRYADLAAQIAAP